MLQSMGSHETVRSETWAQPSWTDVLAAGSLTEPVNKDSYGFGECNQTNKPGAVINRNIEDTREAVHSPWGGPLS